MRIDDIINRFLLFNSEMAEETTYTYDASGNLTQEVRKISNKAGTKTVTTTVTITYEYTGTQLTKKTVTVSTEE
jgi:YD repeat-containing protein